MAETPEIIPGTEVVLPQNNFHPVNGMRAKMLPQTGRDKKAYIWRLEIIEGPHTGSDIMVDMFWVRELLK